MELSLTRCMWLALCIFILVAAGSSSAKSPPVVTTATTAPPVPTPCFYISMVITNRIYNNSLLNPSSPDYKEMYKEVNGVLNAALLCPSCGTQSSYRGVQAMVFRHGSVIAVSTVMFETYFINAFLLLNIFRGTVSSAGGKINGLTINPSLIQVLEAFPSSPTTGTSTTTVVTTSSKPKSTSISHKTTILATTSPTTSTFTTHSPATTTPKATSHESTTHTSTSYTITTVTSRAPSKSPNTHTQAHLTMSSSTSPSKQTGRNTITSTMTTTKPFFKTTSKNAESTNPSKQPLSTKISSSTNIFSSTTRGQEPLLRNTTLPSYNQYEGVPGWAIALLVLACVILVLLIILLIIAIVRCCTDDNDKVASSNEVPEAHTPYGRRAFKEPLSTPSYSPHTPQKSPIVPTFEDPMKPRVNRTGMYMVNPESS